MLRMQPTHSVGDLVSSLSERELAQPMLRPAWECEGTQSGAVKPPRQANHPHAA